MEFNLKLDENQINVILRCLAQAPYATVVELVPSIQRQCQEQAQAAQQPAQQSPGLTE